MILCKIVVGVDVGVVFGKGLKNKPGDCGRCGIDRSEHRPIGIGWNLFDLIQSVRNLKQGGIQIGPGPEGQDDGGPAFPTFTRHFDQPWNRLELLFLAFRNLPLDLARTGPAPEGLDRNLRLDHLRRQLNRNFKEGD